MGWDFDSHLHSVWNSTKEIRGLPQHGLPVGWAWASRAWSGWNPFPMNMALMTKASNKKTWYWVLDMAHAKQFNWLEPQRVLLISWWEDPFISSIGSPYSCSSPVLTFWIHFVEHAGVTHFGEGAGNKQDQLSGSNVPSCSHIAVGRC